MYSFVVRLIVDNKENLVIFNWSIWLMITGELRNTEDAGDDEEQGESIYDSNYIADKLFSIDIVVTIVR